MVDWVKIKTEYITTATSYRKLAEKYGIGYQAICHKSQEEGWIELREQHRNNTITKALDQISDKEAKKLSRIDDLADKLLSKLERAVEELDLHLCTNKTKVKEIEYNNDLRPDKPTKEVIREEETVESAKGMVDRVGLKAIASALRDLKEVKMVMSELDRQEQEARIANLRRQAEAEEKVTGAKLVVEGLPEEFKV